MPTKTTAAGDATGRKRQQLAKEHAEELRKRDKEITLINAVEQSEVDNGVYDPSSGTLVDGAADPEKVAAEQGITFVDDDDEVIDTAPARPIAPQYHPQAAQAAQEIVEVDSLAEPLVIIRVNTDLEQMTFGQGNHFSFEAGKQYRVTRSLANHLEEKGYVWH